MSDRTFDVEYLEVGDSYTGGPIEQSYFIGAVLGAGGQVSIDGNTVYIVALPKKAPESVISVPSVTPMDETTLEKTVELIKKTAKVEPKVETPKVEPKVEAPKVEEPKEYPIADLAAEEAVIEEAPKSKRTYKKAIPEKTEE
jgi:hypothetical protein